MNRPVLQSPDPAPAAKPIALPDYLVDTYSWAYLRPRSLQLLDRHLVVNAILWGNYRRLVRSACVQFHPGERVLQAASVYGNLSGRLSRRLGAGGRLEVIDIAPLQVEHCRRKLAGRGNVECRLADAAEPGGGEYDGVCCFFLLHEVPDAKKRQVVDGLLGAVRPGGRVVFTDYHRPTWWHPLRPVMAAVFRWLEPYASGLLAREVRDLASRAGEFSWQKTSCFGGLYQQVVAIRKSS